MPTYSEATYSIDCKGAFSRVRIRSWANGYFNIIIDDGGGGDTNHLIFVKGVDAPPKLKNLPFAW